MIYENAAKKELRCSRCGSKEVILIRRYSGEALCRKCLRESLLSRMRKSVSKYNILTRNDSLLYIRTRLPYDNVLWELFQDMESEFPVKIDYIHTDIGLPAELWNSLYDIAKELPERKKFIFPLILDDVVALFLRFIFRGSPSILIIRGRVFLAMKEISTMITPFVEIPIEEAWALSKGEVSDMDDMLGYIFRNNFLSMAFKLEKINPGARFSLLRSLERLDLLRSIGIIFR